MAKVNSNSMMRNTRGMIGKQVVFKTRLGTPYVAAAPTINPNRVPTENQKASQEKFKFAISYAKSAIADEQLKAAYTKVKKKRQTAFNVAMNDAYHGPEIIDVISAGYKGRVGDIIVVHAQDNFRVALVNVQLLNAEGKIIEEGAANSSTGALIWTYFAKHPNANPNRTAIKILAADFPGNTTEYMLSF